MSLDSPKLIDRKPDTLISAPGWAVWLYRLRWLPALLAAALCAAAWPAARQVVSDPSNDAFIIREDLSWYEHNRFVRAFGAEESVAIAVNLPDGLDAAAAALLVRLEEELKAVPGVEAVHGLGGLTRHQVRWFGRIEEKPFFEKLLSGGQTPDVFLKDRAAWPPPAPQLLSGDGRTAAVIVSLKEGSEAALDPVREAVRRVLPETSSPILTGTLIEHRAFASQIEEDRRTFVPLCIGVIVVLLILFHLDLRTVLYSLAVMGGSLAITEAAMALTGARVHAVTALLAPVILIVAVSSTIKACGIFDLARDTPQPSLRMLRALRGMFVPCFLANLTTFIGFCSLLVSAVPAVRDFGRFGAVGTAAAFALTLAAAPFFAAWTGGRAGTGWRFDPFRSVGHAIAWIVRKASWPILAAAVAFTVLAAREIPQIRTSTDLLKIFKPADPFRRDTELFMQKMGGIYPLEVMLEPASIGGMASAAAWDRLDAFQRRLAEMPDVSRVSGPTDVVAYFEKVSGRPRSDALTATILDELFERNDPGWRHLAADRASKLRFTVFLTSSDTARVTELARGIPVVARETLGEDWETLVAGETRLLAEMSQRLVADEAHSVLIAFGVILALIILVTRSVPYAVLGVLPNILPIAGLFGLMSVLRIGLNTATVMIASVAIGLVFDNTVYLLYGYREARRHGMDADAAVTHALSRRFKPMFASSLILGAGFAVTMMGHMVPTVQFGFLSCVTLGLAAVSDLFVLPALLRIFRPR